MRFRSKLAILSLAALAGFIVSRPDLVSRLTDALEKGKEAALQKENELTKM